MRGAGCTVISQHTQLATHPNWLFAFTHLKLTGAISFSLYNNSVTGKCKTWPHLDLFLWLVLCCFCFSPSSEPPLSGNFSSVSSLEVHYSASQYFNLSFLFYSLCSSQFPPLTQLEALFLFLHISNILVRSTFLEFFALLFLVFSFISFRVVIFLLFCFLLYYFVFLLSHFFSIIAFLNNFSYFYICFFLF